MNILQDSFEKTIHETINFNELLSAAINKRFKNDLGITLTPEQLTTIVADLQRDAPDSVRIDITDEQLVEANLNADAIVEYKLDLDRIGTDIETMIQEIVQACYDYVMNELAQSVLEEIVTEIPPEPSQEAIADDHFSAWVRPLYFLEVLLDGCLHCGQEFSDEFTASAIANDDYLTEALVRLQARGCQVAGEIHLLLKHGFADGAHARWRTLHEIAVVARFLADHGLDVAKRYLDHEWISRWQMLTAYQAVYSDIGYQAPEAEDVKLLRAKYDEMMAKYSEGFESDFGWAYGPIPNRRPKLADLQHAVGLKHMNFFVKLSQGNVHALSAGLMIRLGTRIAEQDTILAGASDAGLALPGTSAAYSLVQVTAALLLSKYNIDRILFCSMLSMLSGTISQEFDIAEDRILDTHLTDEPPLDPKDPLESTDARSTA